MSKTDNCRCCPACLGKDTCMYWKPDIELTRLLEGVPMATDESLFNEHGKYVVRYARNNGISIAEAHEAPMVKAHLVYFNSTKNLNKNILQYGG